MADVTRWGIMGTGNIASQFARGLKPLSECELVAVGSRSKAKAEAFSQQFDVPRAHGSYESLVSDPDVDAIYISTPHPYHCDNTLLCLNEGKAVLCEKPFAINVLEAERMISAAKQNSCFLMEAMWTRFFPAIEKMRELIAEGAIGEVRLVKADFCFASPFDPQSRVFKLELAGGSLMDVGVYPIALASMVFDQEPKEAISMVNLGSTGVDEQASIMLGYESGSQAVLTCGIRLAAPLDAYIIGTKGLIHLPEFSHPTSLTLETPDQQETLSFDLLGNGYGYEALEVHRQLQQGRLESDRWPLEQSRRIMHLLDSLRAQWGLKYPMET
jgi:predicted dehydrogenase